MKKKLSHGATETQRRAEPDSAGRREAAQHGPDLGGCVNVKSRVGFTHPSKPAEPSPCTAGRPPNRYRALMNRCINGFACLGASVSLWRVFFVVFVFFAVSWRNQR